MTVLSALFEKIAARVPDAAQAKELLAEAARAESPKHQREMDDAQQPKDDPKAKASNELLALSNQAFDIGQALQKMKMPLTLSQDTEEDEDVANWWEAPTKSFTLELLHEEKRLMLFKASRSDAGGYYIEAEENTGNSAMALTMMNNRPADDIAEVQKALAAHLDSAFNIPANQAAVAMQRLTETIDYRPQRFLDIIKTKPFEEVLAFVNKGINTAHVYDEYPGKFLPLDWVLMSRHQESKDEKTPAPFTPAQRAELFEAVVAQAKPGDRIISRMTMTQAALNGTYELLPRLIELGAKPDGQNFAEAGTHNNDSTRKIRMLKALRPYVADVAAHAYVQRAAESAAASADLETFKWLETQGLNKDAQAPNYMTTFAHWIAGSSQRDNDLKAGREDKWPAFMQYLIDNDYPVNVSGKGGTPLQGAVESGSLDIAKMLMDAGCKPDASLMEKIITPVYYMQKVSTDDAKQFLTTLHEEHGVPFTQGAADRLFQLLRNSAGENYFNAKFAGVKAAAEMIEFFASHGVKVAETPELAVFRIEAAQKLRGADPTALTSLGIEALPVIKRGLRNAPPTP